MNEVCSNRTPSCNFIGIEMTDEYIPIATARIEDAKQEYEQEHNAPFNQLFEVDDE